MARLSVWSCEAAEAVCESGTVMYTDGVWSTNVAAVSGALVVE